VAFIAATSGTGKTTLMEAVIGMLRGKGYRVGTVKHSAHEALVDREGSDSWRFAQAGSDVTVLAAKGLLAVLRAVELPSVEEALLAASADTDIVLVEGFREMCLPKIEVYRSGHSQTLYCRRKEFTDPGLVAVASDTPLEIDVPVLDINRPEEVC